MALQILFTSARRGPNSIHAEYNSHTDLGMLGSTLFGGVAKYRSVDGNFVFLGKKEGIFSLITP